MTVGIMAAPSVNLRHCGLSEADSAPLAPPCSPPAAFAKQRKAPANLRSCGQVVGADRTEAVTELPPSGSALRAVANPLGVEAPPSPIAPVASSPITELLSERQPSQTVNGVSFHHDSPGSRADHVDHLAAQGLYNLASLVDSPKSVSTQSYSSSCCTRLCRWLCASSKNTRVKCIGDFEEDIEQEFKDSEPPSDQPDPKNCTRNAYSGNHGLSEAGLPDDLTPENHHLPSQASSGGLAISAQSKPESSPPSQTPSTQSAAGTVTSPSSASAMPDEVGQSSSGSTFNSASGGVRDEPDAGACEAFDVRAAQAAELAPERPEPPLPTPVVVETVEEPAAERVAVGVSELERTVDMIMWRLREVTPPAERHRVFIEQCRAWHPDKNAGDDRRATVAFQRLQSTRTWFLAKDEPSRSESMDCGDEVPF